MQTLADQRERAKVCGKFERHYLLLLLSGLHRWQDWFTSIQDR